MEFGSMICEYCKKDKYECNCCLDGECNSVMGRSCLTKVMEGLYQCKGCKTCYSTFDLDKRVKL